MNIQQKINRVQSRQLELRAIMAESDERASKCFKSGVSFRETYPEDSARYEAANEEYNANEITLAGLQAEAEREAELEALQPPVEIFPEPETEPDPEPEEADPVPEATPVPPARDHPNRVVTRKLSK